MIAIAMVLTMIYFVVLTYRRRQVRLAPAELKPVAVAAPILGGARTP
jgi:hypothetical protein